LQEFQVIYISRGKGIFESASCAPTVVKEGTILLLFPYEWHRYKPDAEAGWDEWWAGCKGPVLDNLLRRQFFSKEKPLYHIGYQQNVMQLFHDMIGQTGDELPGYQPLISSAVMHLLGLVQFYGKQETAQEDPLHAQLVNKAMQYMRTHMSQAISFDALCKELQVSYSHFRKAFKSHTGMPPHQYLLELRMEKSRQLLATTPKAVKEIAFDAGFESAFYFSRMFKKKMGTTPGAYRKSLTH
ncbi:AraC family transcriptional regulator, partial [uncultured Chitinophaga sp.]|uniref:AraC family transcriptional regulator n=1 Tax=uncultured Chitinophaga sp. TaxID=339340 RepID=UPI0025E79E88